jgi:hypothetical protein
METYLGVESPWIKLALTSQSTNISDEAAVISEFKQAALSVTIQKAVQSRESLSWEVLLLALRYHNPESLTSEGHLKVIWDHSMLVAARSLWRRMLPMPLPSVRIGSGKSGESGTPGSFPLQAASCRSCVAGRPWKRQYMRRSCWRHAITCCIWNGKHLGVLGLAYVKVWCLGGKAAGGNAINTNWSE